MSNHSNRRVSDRASPMASFISEGTLFKGTLGGDTDCVVLGEFEGDCDIHATLLLEKGGVWRGQIIADNVVISGTVEGDVTVRQQVELNRGAQVRGNVTGANVAIAEGAILDGELRMTGSEGAKYFQERRGGR